jgi:hypothetical protein
MLANCLAVGLSLNNSLQIKIHRPPPDQVPILDEHGLTNVDFIRINDLSRTLPILKGASLTLVDNKFPAFIFEHANADNQKPLFNFIEGLGYKVYPVSGCANIYLASDHPLRPKRVSPETEQPSEEAPKFDLPTLIKMYETGATDPISLLEPQDQWEGWYLMAHHYRNRGHHQKAYECAQNSWNSNPPPSKEHLIQEEISIVAFYLGKHPEGYNACEQIVLSNAPWDLRNRTLRNQAFYMKPLPMSRSVPLDYALPLGFIASSTAIMPREGGYQANLRAVNYTINSQGGYVIRDPDQIVRTRNFILQLDLEFNIVGPGVELIDRSGIQLYPQNILGMEDIRCFGDRQFFCTNLEVNQARVPQICYGRYDTEGNVTELHPLMVGSELKCEKNWLPYIYKGEIRFIYTFGPFRIYRLPAATLIPELVKEIYISDQNIGDFRGSACPIPYKGGWLFTVHQVYYANPRGYFHRLAWADLEFTSLKYSPIFYFESPDIEYNLSICESAAGLLIAYSVRDNCSKIGILPYGDVDRMLALE